MATSGSSEFDKIRRLISSDAQLKSELEFALAANINRLDPSDRANRFGSGAAVEWILAALTYHAGILTIPAGHNANGFDLVDLRLQSRGLWSVKNTSKTSSFRITNGMGGPGKGFSDPIIFLSPTLPGLVFANPKIHRDLANKVRIKDDATELPFQAIKKHAVDHPECVAECLIPENQNLGREDPWMNYVENLLDPTHFPRLSRMFADAKPARSNVASSISILADLRNEGKISQVEFEIALSKL